MLIIEFNMNSIYFFFFNSSLIRQRFKPKKILFEQLRIFHSKRLSISIILSEPAGFSRVNDWVTWKFYQQEMV